MTGREATPVPATPGERICALLPAGTTALRLEAENAAVTASGRSYAFVSEIHLRIVKDATPQPDLLSVIAMFREGATGGRELESLYALGSDSFRSRASSITAGLLIGDLPVGPIPDRVSQLGVMLFRIPRARRFGRVVEAIQSLTTAVQYAPGAEGVQALITGVVDRLELLADSAEVSTVIAGLHRITVGITPHYAVFFGKGSDGVGPDSAAGAEPAFFVRDGHLSAGRSRTSASSWRGGEFLLFSIGQARPAADPNRFDRLRRQHTLIDSGALLLDPGAAPEIYQRKVARLRVANRLASQYGTRAAQRLPVTTPISITVGFGLDEAVALNGELSPEFVRNLSLMRDGLKYELGSEFPGVRVMSSAADPADVYAISIDEIPIVAGKVERRKVFCNDTVERLTLLNISGEPAVNPANGNDAAWVAAELKETLEAAGITTWTTTGYLILHLSSVLRKNAAVFATLQAVGKLLPESLRKDVLAAPGGLPRFAGVIRGLLEDEVPIHETKAICQRYLEITHMPTHEILEEIRALPLVNQNLFWNREVVPIYRLGEKFVELMHKGITDGTEATVLALEPEPTKRVLAQVRDMVGSLPPTAKNPVIFCEDWRIRAFVRKLVELEFPHLRVVSRRECKDPDAMPVIGIIEMED